MMKNAINSNLSYENNDAARSSSNESVTSEENVDKNNDRSSAN